MITLNIALLIHQSQVLIQRPSTDGFQALSMGVHWKMAENIANINQAKFKAAVDQSTIIKSLLLRALNTRA